MLEQLLSMDPGLLGWSAMTKEVEARMRKTKLMQDVESRENRGDIERWLLPMVQELGYPETARRLGINKATVERWSLWMGYRSERRVVPVGRGVADLEEES